MAEDPAPPPAPPPAPRPGPDYAFLVCAAVALVAALVLVRNLLPAKRDLVETLREEERLRQAIDRLRAEEADLELKERALREDDRFVERELHRQTGMTRPGEWIVR